MKKYLPHLTAMLFLFLAACGDSDEIEKAVLPVVVEPEVLPVNPDAGINNFIYSGMNIYYRWKDDVPVLANDRFSNNEEYNAFLQASGNPETFLETLVYNRQSVDKDSRVETDYKESLANLQGDLGTNGVDFSLALYGDNKVLGYVRLILPGSDADGKNIKRGDIFTEVDGREMTLENYRSLLFSDNPTYTLNIASIVSNTITPTGETVELTKMDYDENPVFNVSFFEEGGRKIGYIHYMQFTAKESELNAAFLELKNEGITDLVVDLRYNGGGYSAVSTSLSGMITGQFTGEIVKKEKWNSEAEAQFESQGIDRSDRFRDQTSGFFSDEQLNSLNMNSVHFITSGSTASASESLIKGLMPYINVKVVGETTYGKNRGGFTLYDSEDFGIEGANPDHTIALYPIMYTITNKLDEGWANGIEPDVYAEEDLANLGVIGSRSEPLLKAAINDIVGISSKVETGKTFDYEVIADSRSNRLIVTDVLEARPEVRDALKKMRSKK